MSQEKNSLELVKQVIQAPKDAIAMIELPEVRSAWVATYQNYIGAADGSRRWEQEKNLAIQALNDNPKLMKCDRFTLYIALQKLAMSNLTLNEQMAYLVPYGNKAVFIPGWKGRLQQINEMPDVVHIHEPQLVYMSEVESGNFEYELGETPRIIKHKPTLIRKLDDEIVLAYLFIETKTGTKLLFLDRDKAFVARAKSPTYKYWMGLLKSGKQISDDGCIRWDYQGETYTTEPPLWVSAPADAWRKTIVKRAYDQMPNKLGRHKELDKYEKENGIDELDGNDIPVQVILDVEHEEIPPMEPGADAENNYKGF